MTPDTPHRPIEILLIDDSPGDVRLTREALADAKIRNVLHVAHDGVEALELLRRGNAIATASGQPDLILLDLNMPRMDGREVLTELKADETLRHIPVVVLTTSDADVDVLRSYRMQAACYISKPVDLDRFMLVIQSIQDFWLTVVKYPSHDAAADAA